MQIAIHRKLWTLASRRVKEKLDSTRGEKTVTQEHYYIVTTWGNVKYSPVKLVIGLSKST